MKTCRQIKYKNMCLWSEHVYRCGKCVSKWRCWGGKETQVSCQPRSSSRELELKINRNDECLSAFIAAFCAMRMRPKNILFVQLVSLTSKMMCFHTCVSCESGPSQRIRWCGIPIKWGVEHTEERSECIILFFSARVSII